MASLEVWEVNRMNHENTTVIRVDELAKILSIGRNTAYELVRSGKIRSVKIGRTYKIPLTAVDDYLNSPVEDGIM